MSKRYRYFCITIWNLYSEVSKILEGFMPFGSWTGVLQVQHCFEIIDTFVFGMLYLSFKFSLWLHVIFMASWPSVVGFRFTKMPLKLLWSLNKVSKARSTRSPLDHNTYLTGRIHRLQRILPRVSPSTYLNQFLIQPHPHFSATVNI